MTTFYYLWSRLLFEVSIGGTREPLAIGIFIVCGNSVGPAKLVQVIAKDG